MPILRLPQVQAQLGYSRSRFYLDVQRGLLPKQIKTGERASGLPDFEVAAIERAIIAGASDDERRALVQRLHKARSANRMQSWVTLWPTSKTTPNGRTWPRLIWPPIILTVHRWLPLALRLFG